MNTPTLKKKVFELIDHSHSHGKSRIFNLAMLILIILNVLAVVLETEDTLYLPYKQLFDGFELFSIIVFTAEYILRLWVCTEDPRFNSPFWGRIRYAIRPMALVDLISFLPFYLRFISEDLRFIRALRLFRLFRVLKLNRYSDAMNRIKNVIAAKKEELGITLFVGFIVLIISSSVMYFIEKDAQPDVFSSIPATMWWAVATLTTVGYGDIYPKTVLGKVLGSFIAVLGIGLFALPAGIIASGFFSEVQKESKERIICPHCGKVISEKSNVDIED